MTSRDFCFWLQGHFEIQGAATEISAEKAIIIRNHLALVFKHEIDPSMPDPTGEMQAIHDGKPLPVIPQPKPHSVRPDDIRLRC